MNTKNTKSSEVMVNDQKMEIKKENSVENFIMAAIEKGLPVETMERLFTLREKVLLEQSKQAFTGAMAKFQAECPIIEKMKSVMNKDGKSIRYKYAPLDSIVSQVKKALGENDLSYNFDEMKDDKFITAICKITHKMGHSETSSFKVPIGNEDFMNDTQKYGARMTFAKRYAFCNALGILTGDEDNDAKDVDGKKKQKKYALNVKADIMQKLKKLGVDITKKETIREEIFKLTQITVNDDESNLIEIVNRLDVLISEQNENR